MQTIKDWAQFYKDRKLWVYPYNLEEKDWLYWKKLNSEEEYNQIAQEWNWNSSDGIKLVVGKKGIRVLEVHNKRQLKKALNLLGFPNNYPWIIHSQAKYGIVVDTPSISPRVKGMYNRGYKNSTLIWEGYYVLPSVGVSRYFYKNHLPQGHPSQVSDDVFINCFEKLI